MKKYWVYYLIFGVIIGAIVINAIETPSGPISPVEGEYESNTNYESENDSVDNSEPASTYNNETVETDPVEPAANSTDSSTEDPYQAPADVPSDDPADYNADGEYKPADQMTQEEIEAEILEIMESNLGQ